jgi:DNA polymerase-3 subunit epsilon
MPSPGLTPVCTQGRLLIRSPQGRRKPMRPGEDMQVKSAILARLSAEVLETICPFPGRGVNSPGRQAMVRHLLGQESITAASLLPYLTEAELREVCAACGVPATGRPPTLIKRLLALDRGPTFVALDFETADYSPDSACALGLVRVENYRIVRRTYHLIRPPRRRFVFTYLHGITWEDVAHQPTFAELWPSLTPMLAGVDFLAAHNASFDRSVLHRCCETAGLIPPALPFECTVRLARQTWSLYPTKLDNVCDHLGITLSHHHAASDAEACALIVIAAHRDAVADKPGKKKSF